MPRLSTASSAGRRSRTGCINCRRKKKKCDEGKPTCSNCVKTSEKCVWSRPLSFLPQNAFTIGQTAGPTSIAELSQPPDRAGVQDEGCDVVARLSARSPYDGATRPCAEPLDICVHDTRATFDSSNVERGHSMPTPSSTTQGLSQPVASTDPVLNHTDALALPSIHVPVDSLDTMTLPAVSGADFEISPEMSEDGIFLPGSLYEELHTTLRQNILSTARPQHPSYQVTPARHANGENIASSDNVASETGHAFELGPADPEAEVVLDPLHEYVLWKNWINEIAEWLDMFDTERHFARVLPVMAQTCRHLRYSMLALSSRQIERKHGSIPESVTLSLYSAAVHLLVPQLHHRDTTVLASCVIICVLEMMSCSPKAWRRHLDGCACLVRSMGIFADSRGLERALFLCFMRMDLCGGLISREPTLIPMSEWTSQQSFEADVALFQSRSDVEWRAIYACYLLGCVIRLLFSSSAPDEAGSRRSQDEAEASYSNKWHQLFVALEDWYDTRPAAVLPVVCQKATPAQPFPTLLFSSGAAINGNQLHHTAAIIMLQNIPRLTKRSSNRSILWHARRVCGITIYNDHHGCWVNSIQPLWIAGRVMSHPTEHQAINDIYARIEEETGWGATWRAEDLKQFWGNID